jgi:ATP-dependent helicase/DNAse subunit B
MPLTADPPESEDETPTHLLSGITANDPDAIAASDPHLVKRSTLIRKLTLKKDGSFGGDLLSREQIEALKDLALSEAANAAQRILDGEADICPTESACTYCPYDAVCRFDRQLGCRMRYVPKTELSELLKEGDPS